MSTTVTSKMEEEHTEPPYLYAFIALAILTIIEVFVGVLDASTIVTILLGALALGKAAIVAAVFMHVAYEKDTRNIIVLCFIVPMIGVLILASTIHLDYRNF